MRVAVIPAREQGVREVDDAHRQNKGKRKEEFSFLKERSKELLFI
jgi:hypothetical protein